MSTKNKKTQRTERYRVRSRSTRAYSQTTPRSESTHYSIALHNRHNVGLPNLALLLIFTQ